MNCAPSSQVVQSASRRASSQDEAKVWGARKHPSFKTFRKDSILGRILVWFGVSQFHIAIAPWATCPVYPHCRTPLWRAGGSGIVLVGGRQLAVFGGRTRWDVLAAGRLGGATLRRGCTLRREALAPPSREETRPWPRPGRCRPRRCPCAA